jgi:cupin 2 domain-containing protein
LDELLDGIGHRGSGMVAGQTACALGHGQQLIALQRLQLARQRLPALALWIRWRGVAMAPPAGIQLLDLLADGARPDVLERPTMFPTAHALLHALPDARLAEVFDTLAAAGPVRIERIVSHGQASPEGFWYDQAQAEWVMVVQGAARLAFADGEVALAAGDWLTIPAHCRHRVAWTDNTQPTLWLALHAKG